ncbi:hypothetical protein HYH03_006756 [Edaphochlamys debaryana]|uniref:EamA domain-containing protein n=1 Tax=Edaphochlamys debaryana TaxID=47281 RepID=A0A836C124_9CHLO|nr:hypothetical protein HYH03_006756 [Edaphochlamys debaryana]|eukprot:KAG2495148.1 hypothetical protein HYH03_006756 [Edaphochlamys debaryana]
MTASVFFGQLLCLPLACYLEWRGRREAQQAAETEPCDKLQVSSDDSSSDDDQPTTRHPSKRPSWFRVLGLVTVPTLLSIASMACLSIGLLHVTASVWQMLRGLEVLFAAVLGVLFLGRRLNRFHLTGVALSVIGVAVVGLSYVLSGGASTGDTSTTQMVLGLGLIVASLALQAAALTAEEHLMRREAIGGALLMALQGVIGSVILVGVILPAVYYLPGQEGEGIHEDTLDTLVMISNSPALIAVVVVDVLALMPYYLATMAVTHDQGAVFLTVIESLRTISVWGVMLILFYARVAGGTLGEAWSSWSWMQVGGFMIMIAAALAYG